MNITNPIQGDTRVKRESRSAPLMLIVDDREEDREVLSGILKTQYDVLLASSGEECLKLIPECHPDIVLLDINMPGGIDGIKTLQEIREQNRNLPVVIITGVGTYERNVETYRLGANDFIAKPYNICQLYERLEKILAEREKSGNEDRTREMQISLEEEFFKREYINMIQALCELIELKNPYTYRHSQKVTKYAVEIAEQMGLSREEVDQVKQSGLIHDIGKIGIVDAILNKPGRLTDEEFAEIKQHPVLGTKVLKHLRLLQPEMAIIEHHHERWDGKGYPDGLKGNKIPRASRILAVADSLDAMLSNRPYRPVQTLEYAISELQRCCGTQFDPEVVEAFLTVLARKPDILEIDKPR
ncbi:MAG: HD domain-containing phosphohydrolase [bacterium]